MAQTRPSEPVTLQVITTGRVSNPATLIKITAQVQSTASTMSGARSANAAQVTRAIAAVRATGIPAGRIQELPPQRSFGSIGNEAAGDTAMGAMIAGQGVKETAASMIEIRLSDGKSFGRCAMRSRGRASRRCLHRFIS